MSERHASPQRNNARNERIESADEVVAKKIPWMGISIALHVIALSILIVFFVPREESQTKNFVAIVRPTVSAPDTIDLVPEPERVRTTIPDYEAPAVESDEQVSLTMPAADAVDPGRSDLKNQTTDADAIDPGTGFDYAGGTAIGVGIVGHRGVSVSNRAGPLGTGGGLGNGGDKYGKRGDPKIRKLSRVQTAALDWLARHQDENGSWSPSGYTAHCEGVHCEGAGEDAHMVGITGLALLAFLGAGDTLTEGKHPDVVKQGVKYLLSVQNKETGAFGEPGSTQSWIYDQAIASLALCEAYGLSENPALKKPAQKAVYYCQSGRNPYKAWRYAIPPNGDNDVSVTGWMVMVLRSAQDFGLIVDDQAFDGAKLFLDEMTDANNGRTGYVQKGSGGAREPGTQERWPAEKVEPMTAVAMLCRIFMGEDQAMSPTLRQGADLLRKSLPSWDEADGSIDYYYWYYGSYAMFQMGGPDWTAWDAKMQDAIVTHQIQKGCESGSWDPRVDAWGHRGGRVYSTAILALCSEVHTRYGRVIGKRETKGGAEERGGKK